MKKSLLTLAALATFGSAQAQQQQWQTNFGAPAPAGTFTSISGGSVVYSPVLDSSFWSGAPTLTFTMGVGYSVPYFQLGLRAGNNFTPGAGNLTATLTGPGGFSASQVFSIPGSTVAMADLSANLFRAGNTPWANGNYTLSFTSASRFDNISVTAVPEPSTYAMLAAGLAGVSFLARRRQRAVADAPAATV